MCDPSPQKCRCIHACNSDKIICNLGNWYHQYIENPTINSDYKGQRQEFLIGDEIISITHFTQYEPQLQYFWIFSYCPRCFLNLLCMQMFHPQPFCSSNPKPLHELAEKKIYSCETNSTTEFMYHVLCTNRQYYLADTANTRLYCIYYMTLIGV